MVMCPRFQVWRVPGGRAEHGERIEETLLREMKEETGITFTNPTYLGFGQDQQFHVRNHVETSRLIMFFHVTTDEEPTLDPDEAMDHRWVTLEEMKELKDKEGAMDDLFARTPTLAL